MRLTLLFLALLVVTTCFSPLATLADHPAAGFGHGIAGPIVTIPAGTLSRGSWAASLRVEWVNFDPFSDEELEAAALAGEDLHSTDRLLSPSFALAYGVANDLAVGVRLPYVARYDIREAHLEAGVPEVHRHGDSKGLGDLTVLAQYRFVRNQSLGVEAALLLGVKFPTGLTDAEGEDGERFELEHQPGSGSTDPLVGLAWSKPLGPASVDGNALATLPTEGSEETRLGTLVNYNLAVSVRPGGEHRHEASQGDHEHLALDIEIEANGEWRGPTEIAEEEEDNSGGSLIYLTPGLRLGTDGRWSVSGSVGLPIVQNLRGKQHETSVRILLGLGLAF